MKGILEKTYRGWIVKRLVAEGPQEPAKAKFVETFPLHKSDVENIEPCVLGEYGEVDFDLVREYVDVSGNQVQVYARLATPMLDRLRAHLDTVTPEQFEKEIEDIIRNDASTYRVWECCGMEDCICDSGPTDDEIEEAGIEWHNSAMLRSRISFVAGAKWYREEIRKKQKNT